MRYPAEVRYPGEVREASRSVSIPRLGRFASQTHFPFAALRSTNHAACRFVGKARVFRVFGCGQSREDYRSDPHFHCGIALLPFAEQAGEVAARHAVEAKAGVQAGKPRRQEGRADVVRRPVEV